MIGTMKEEDIEILGFGDCVLKHPHQGKHLQSKTVIRRLKDPRWKNRCVLCGKETDTGLSVCGVCFFDKKFSIKKEVKEAERILNKE